MLTASVYRTSNNPLALWLLGVALLFWLQNTAVSQVVINEFMASNSLAFEDSDFQNTGDWVEHSTYIILKENKLRLKKYQFNIS